VDAGAGDHADRPAVPPPLEDRSAAHTTGMRPGGPTRRGAASSPRSAERALLTHLLTTALDQPGHARNGMPPEQADCDQLDISGHLSSSS
jgi:hypothetical protein